MLPWWMLMVRDQRSECTHLQPDTETRGVKWLWPVFSYGFAREFKIFNQYCGLIEPAFYYSLLYIFAAKS